MDIGAHVFRTTKFRRMKEELIKLEVVKEREIVLSPYPTAEEVGLVLAPEYVDDLTNLRWSPRTLRSELPLTKHIVEGCMRTAGGTLEAARLAVKTQAPVVHIGGGFHHGFATHGEGFCYINDVAIAAAGVVASKLAQRVAIIDTDVHQGNGTARIFQGDDSVYTFSIHQENLYPIKEKSDWDVGLEDGTAGEEYLENMKAPLDHIFGTFRPDLVLYVGGVDPYEFDQLGGLRLTMKDLNARDRLVLSMCAQAKVPFVTVVSGGYAEEADDTVRAHVQTALAALSVADSYGLK